MLLHEGWALTQSGADSLTLAGHALRLRQAGMAPSLKQLMGPRWYHQDSGPVYDIGGGLTNNE